MIAATGGLSEIDALARGLSRTGAEGEIFTLTGRTELWATAWKLILEKPLLGWGYNGIEDVMARTVSAGFEGTAVNAHNMLLQTLASLGFVGSLAGNRRASACSGSGFLPGQTRLATRSPYFCSSAAW